MRSAPNKIDCAVGVVKAYTTRVGGGPFPTELTDARGGGERPMHSEGTDVGLHLQTVGAEIGVTTGRKRRCGWFDAQVVQYGHVLNGYRSLNLTKLDILDALDEVKIAVGYSLRGKRLPYGAIPSTLEELAQVTVHYETLPGWKTSIAGATRYQDLPDNTKRYVERIEQIVGVPIAWVGTGPNREHMIPKGFNPL